MMNRREFIQTGATAVVLTGIGHAPRAFAASLAPMGKPLYKAIYDERFRDSVAFADEATRLGVGTHAIRGDITDLWFKDLDSRWRLDKATVAGLTTESALFCLEQFSWDHRMRVVYRAEHEFLEGGRVAHTFQCSQTALKHVEAFERNRLTDWAPRVAQLVASVSLDRFPAASKVVTTSLPAPARDGLELLVSWIIAAV